VEDAVVEGEAAGDDDIETAESVMGIETEDAVAESEAADHVEVEEDELVAP